MERSIIIWVYSLRILQHENVLAKIFLWNQKNLFADKGYFYICQSISKKIDSIKLF